MHHVTTKIDRADSELIAELGTFSAATSHEAQGRSGAFDDAIDWRLHKFSDFPTALAAHRDELAGKTVVSYCTGGIRCEKAAMVLEAEGLRAWQLDGGILKYFEDTGGPHYHGGCFVFDERESLAPDLSPIA